MSVMVLMLVIMLRSCFKLGSYMWSFVTSLTVFPYSDCDGYLIVALSVV